MLFTLLTGCASMPKPDKVIIMPQYSDMIAIPKVMPTTLKPLSFKVMNGTQLTNFEKLHTNETIVLYSLDDANLQIFTTNLDDLHRYIKEQQAVITYLTGVIDLRRDPGKE
jgi:NAD-dependent SIR2 family protein deacetylase